ncbi:MAG: chorismate-binding protein [Oscillospiraceae bacterium]|nr:chorismate-binding protein [Oscillospiraceae bacterium]
MKISLSAEEVRRFAAETDYQILPVSCEFVADDVTPIGVLRKLKQVSAHSFMLESVTGPDAHGRYTFLGYDPKLAVSCRDGHMKLGDAELKTAHPDAELRRLLAKYRSPKLPGLPPFTGGLVGYFSYDYLGYQEPSVRTAAIDENHFCDLDLMLFDKVIAFDHFRQKLILIVNMRLSEPETEYRRAVLALEQMADLIRNGTPCKEPRSRMTGELTPLFDKETYCGMVERAKHHIFEGDIFQIVLSNRFSAPFEGSLLQTYRMLRTLNPSPYMFYFSGTDVEAAGASPETLVKLENGVLHTYPLAGTRPRGKTEAEDKALEADLLSDEKELAEHNMLVDLGRNDLGRISKFGTVAVEQLHRIERYSHVMHIGSVVRGEIRDDCDGLDAIGAVLPAGTLSGAPKIRACQLIGELEGTRRGIYGGAVGYLSFQGDIDTCIAIRLAYRKKDTVYIRSGAGIVADSVPEKEYQECLNKAAAVVRALKDAEELNDDSAD